MQVVIQAGLRNAETKEISDSNRGEDQICHRIIAESASRACYKFRGLFNSASSRKHSCSFCQAATPSLRFPTAAGLSFSQPTNLRLRQ
jgi:hypothetical protein